MFEKLLANLPYNPNLVHQLGFYAKRMRREESIRRVGLLFIVLTFVVQFFAFISPPQPTSADGNNDLIIGGISSAANPASYAASYCANNTRDYGSIMQNYGISCNDIAHASTISLSSTTTATGGAHLFSMGWHNEGTVNPNTHKPTNETPVTIAGQTIYWRLLDSFDSGPSSTYKALSFHSAITGHQYYILYTCGNLVSFNIPPAYVPPVVDVCPNKSGVQTSSSQCDVCSNVPGVQTSATQCDVCPTTPGIQLSTSECDVCPLVPGVQTNLNQCKSCINSSGSEDTQACLSFNKTASDPTAGFSDANGQTAQPGDVIVYTLNAKNNGNFAVKNFIMSEDLNDVLVYSKVTDLHGGTINSNDIVSWPAYTLPGGQTESHQITVTVDNPIPQTPPATDDPTQYDHIMSNTYGNTININVPGSPLTPIETAATSLPNTGPGSSLVVAGAIAIVAGYFFARSRLLVDESVIAMQQTTSGGL